jgi:hypothetical protein
VTYNPDLPTLEGEEVIDDFGDENAAEAAAELQALEPMRALTTDPRWETLDRYLAIVETESIEEMVKTRDAAATLEWRARVRLARELRALPESIATKVSELSGALEDDDE